METHETRERRGKAVAHYLESVYHTGDNECNLIDALTDLLHWRSTVDQLQYALTMAEIHYKDETQ